MPRHFRYSYREDIGIMEKKMETTTLLALNREYIYGMYRDYIEIMVEKMEIASY